MLVLFAVNYFEVMKLYSSLVDIYFIKLVYRASNATWDGLELVHFVGKLIMTLSSL